VWTIPIALASALLRYVHNFLIFHFCHFAVVRTWSATHATDVIAGELKVVALWTMPIAVVAGPHHIGWPDHSTMWVQKTLNCGDDGMSFNRKVQLWLLDVALEETVELSPETQDELANLGISRESVEAPTHGQAAARFTFDSAAEEDESVIRHVGTITKKEIRGSNLFVVDEPWVLKVLDTFVD